MMKKLTAGFLAAVLALSLTACGGGGGSANGTAMTEEEMLASAVSVEELDEVSEILEETDIGLFSSDAELGIYALHILYDQNPLTFAETYFDKPYCITGYVDEISDEGFDLEIEPDAGENMEFQISVTLSDPDELLEIKKGDLLTVVAFLSEVDGERLSYIVADSAYIV